jgi:hypothetical protein
MANNVTGPAIEVGSDWVDLYAQSGLTVGSQLLVSTRGNHSVFLAEAETQPASDLEGVEVYPTRQMIVDVNSIGVWARTSHNKESFVVVQEDFIDESGGGA